MRIKRYIISCGLLAIQLCADPTWNANAGGDWGNPSNWTGGVPNSSSATATFPQFAAQTITISGTSYNVGTLTFTSSNLYTFSGSFGLNIFLAINSSSFDPTFSCPIQLSGTVSVTSGVDGVVFSGVVSGSGGLIVPASIGNTLNLSGSSNTYSGTTTIGVGSVLNSTVANGLSPYSQIIVNGSLNTAGSQSIPTISGAGIINLGAGSTLTLTNAATSFEGAINATTGGLAITGGNFSLNNTTPGQTQYTGLTTISSSSSGSPAILVAVKAGVLPAASDFVIGANGFLLLQADNTINSLNDYSSSSLGEVNLEGHALTLAGSSADFSYAGSIKSVTNGWSVVKQGSNNFTFSNLNTAHPSVTGTLTITGGTATANSGATSVGTAVSVASGAIFSLAGNTTIGGLSGAGAVSLGANTLTIGAGNGIFSGTIPPSGGNITVTGGALTLSNATGITVAPLVITGGSVTLSGANMVVTSLSGTGGTLSLGVTNATIGVPFGTTTTYSGTISGSELNVGVFDVASGTLILAGTNTYTGDTHIPSGILQAGSNTALPSTTILGPYDSGAAYGTFALSSYDISVTGLAGSGGLIDLGTGTLTVGPGSLSVDLSIQGSGNIVWNGDAEWAYNSGSPTTNYTGTTTVNAALTLAGPNTSSPVSTIILGGGANLFLSASNSVQNLSSSSTTAAVGLGGYTLTLYGQSGVVSQETYYGTFGGSSGSALVVNFQESANTLTLMSSSAGLSAIPVTVSGGGLIFGASNGIGSLGGSGGSVGLNSGVVLTINGSGSYGGSITGSGGVTLASPASQTLTGLNNNFTGTTTVNSGATLSGGGQSNTLPSASLIQLGGALNLGGQNNAILDLAGDGTVNLGSNTLTLTDAESTFTGSISGTGGVALTGGNFTVSSTSGNLAYSGNTTISGTTGQYTVLVVGVGNSLSTASMVDVEAYGALDLNRNSVSVQNLKGDGLSPSSGKVLLTNQQLTLLNSLNQSTTFAGKISSDIVNDSTPTLTRNGGGTLTLSGVENDYYGITTINNAGILLAAAAGALSPNSSIVLTGTAQLTNNAANTIANLSSSDTDTGTSVNLSSDILTISGGANGSFAGTITGTSPTGGLAVTNLSNLTIKGSSSYLGPTSVDNSFLTAGSSTAFSPNSPVTLTNSGQLALGTNSNTILSLTGDATALVNLGTGSAILTLGDSTPSLTFPGSISGTGGINKQGAGTVVLTGSNNVTYSGGTEISAGTLQAGASSALSPTSNITIDAGATLDISPAGANNTIGALNSTAPNAHVTLGANTLTIAGGAVASSYAGTISGAGGITNSALALTLVTQGNATYQGPTNINGGSVVAGAQNALSPSSGVIMNGTGATLDITAGSNTIAYLSGTDTSATVSLVARTLTLAADNANYPFYGQITGSGGALQKQGTGFLTLYNTGNSYSGTTTITNGSLRAGGSGVFSPDSSVVLGPNGSLHLRSNNNEIANLSGSGAVHLGGGTLKLGKDNAPQTYSGTIDSTDTTINSGGIIKVGAGMFTIAGTTTYGGETDIEGGGITAQGANVLSPNSTFYLNGGTLTLDANDNTIGSLYGSSSLSLGGGTLTFGGNNDPAASSYSGVISGTGNLIKTGTQTLVLSGNNTYTGNTTITGGGALSISIGNNLSQPNDHLIFDNGTLTCTGTTSLNLFIDLNGKATINLGPSSELNFGLGFSGPGSLTVTGSSGATVGLYGSGYTYSGPTLVEFVSFGPYEAGSMSPNSEITLQSGGVLYFDVGSSSSTIANLFGDATGQVQLNTSVLTLGNSNNSTFDGTITGTAPAGITKVGSGVFNLTGLGGASSYGPTLIQEGTFAFNGACTTDVTVSLGATLGGSGAITGTIINNGTVAPGNSIGTLNIIGSFTQAAGSSYQVEVSPTLSDLIATTGSFTIAPGANLSVVPLRGYYTPGVQYTVIEATGGLSGTFTNIIASERIAVETDYTPNNLYLYVTVKNFVDLVLGENARNVANVIDALNLIDPPEWNSVLDGLFELPSADVEQALNQLDPAQLKGLAIIQQNNAVRVQNGINLRFQNLLDKTNCSELECCREKRSPFYLWVDGFNSRLRQPSNFIDTNPQVGYHSNTGGGVMGLDCNFLKTGYVGVVGGGTYSDVQWVSGQGKGHITSGYFGLYGSVIAEKRFVNLSLLGSTNKYGAFRNIIYPGMDATAISEHTGLQLLSHIDAGLNFSCYGVTIRPFESLDYIIQHENAFQEYNAGVLNLDVQSNNPQIVRNELGVNFAKCVNINKQSRLLADLKLSWVNESRLKGTYFTSSFINYEDMTFITAGYYPNRNFFAPAATLTFNFFHDSSYITVSYDAEIGHHYFDQRTSLQLGLHF